ncbi:MAG: YciI family protein [Croceimicrobium sp.]
MRTLIILSILSCFPLLSVAQVKVDDQGFETFEMTEGDTTFVMKKYFLVLLKSGDQRNQDELEAAKIQTAHLAHMDSLANLGQLDMAGPMGDNGDLKGIVVLRVPTMERAKACVQADPAVRAGRLSYELHPWWAAKGSMLR